MSDGDTTPTIAPGHWIATIRRADISLDRKGAMLIFASYADFVDDPRAGRAAGEGIHPGTDRYAKDLRKSLATARRYLAWARDIGIIELTRRANRRRGLCDEYRLTLSMEALERLGVPDPTEYRGLIANAAQARRDTAKSARARRAEVPDGPDPDDPEPTLGGDGPSDYRSPKTSANGAVVSAPMGSDYRSAKVSANNAISAQIGGGLALTLDERPPYIEPPSISFTDHDENDLRTELTVPRARPPSEDQISRDVDHDTTATAPPGGTAPPAAPGAEPRPTSPLFADEPEPTRQPCPTGLGFCVTCYAAGDVTLAADPVSGSHCAHHLRRRASA